MLDLGDKKLCDLCFEEVINEACNSCDGVSNTERYITALKEGTVLAGKYAVGRVLGKGGFGVTYLCFDLKNGKKVAIKEYFPDSLVTRNTVDYEVKIVSEDKKEAFEEGAKKFYEEAQTVSKFKNAPNVIHVNEFFYENKTAYLVMEYLEGIDLKSYIRQKGGRLASDEAISITSKVIDALSVIHAEGVLHRDIAPDNIFICKNGDIKLIDFGAARFVLGEASKSLSAILKQGFAPLEQYNRKGTQGPWTDIYALGATLYFALTGKIIDDVMSRIEDDSIDMKGIPADLQPILLNMLAVKHTDRYQNTTELKAAFGTQNPTPVIPVVPVVPKEEKAETEGLNNLAENPPIAMPKKKNKRMLPIIIAAVLLAVIAVAAVFLLKGCDDETLPAEKNNSVIVTPSDEPTDEPEIPSDEPSDEPEPEEPKAEEPKEETKVEPTGLKLSKTSITLTVGESVTLTATVEPSNATDKSITWSSNNPSVVDFVNGKVTAKKAGTAIITASVGTINVTCQVTVKAKNIDVTNVKLDKTELTLTECETTTLNVTVLPDNATDKSITWSSNNPSIAEVVNGKVTAKKAGVATITAKSGDKSASCTVKVNPKPAEEPTAKIVASGKCGDNLTWTYDENGLLTISGKGKMENYDIISKIYAPWHSQKDNIKRVVISDSVTSIGGGAFYYCESLKSITIPDSVTSIGDYAFWNCYSLTSVTIPDSVTSIGDYAFYDCTSLTSITIPDSVTSIGESAFSNCTSLTSITIPDSVTSIGDYAFCGCYSLTSITIPDSVTSIGKDAFFDCDSLTSITIPDSVTSIGEYAFSGCKSLTSITVDKNNKEYSSDKGVLYNKDKTALICCPGGTKMTSFTIPDSVTSIGDEAFKYCTSLTSITIPDSVTSVGYYAFDEWTSSQHIYIEGSTGGWHYQWAFNCYAQIHYEN